MYIYPSFVSPKKNDTAPGFASCLLLLALGLYKANVQKNKIPKNDKLPEICRFPVEKNPKLGFFLKSFF